MKVGDIVRIKGNFQVRNAPEEVWAVPIGQVGMIVELLHASSMLPLANVMVLGKVDQFYLDELEGASEGR
jgi:hypothetical protein